MLQSNGTAESLTPCLLWFYWPPIPPSCCTYEPGSRSTSITPLPSWKVAVRAMFDVLGTVVRSGSRGESIQSRWAFTCRKKLHFHSAHLLHIHPPTWPYCDPSSLGKQPLAGVGCGGQNMPCLFKSPLLWWRRVPTLLHNHST